MTTSEPPESRPTPPTGSGHPSSGPPTSERHASSENPVSDSRTEQIERADPARPSPTRAAGPGRWNPRAWSPRRRWVGIGALVILVLLIAVLIWGIARHHWFGHRNGHHGGPGHSAFQPGMPGGPGVEMGMDGGSGGPMGGAPDGEGRGGHDGRGSRADREGGPMANTASLSGSVVSVAPGNLVLAADGAGQVTVPTNDRTRFMGAGNGLTGLQPGQRVVVRIGGDKSAVAVFSPKARAIGTITAIAGDRATLVRPDGLTEPVDLAAVNPKPVNGDVVAVSGTAADNGATLKVDTLRPMPRAG